jgi:hypothetical protein
LQLQFLLFAFRQCSINLTSLYLTTTETLLLL